MQGTPAFLNFLAMLNMALSSSNDINNALILFLIGIFASCVRRSNPNEKPTAGISLFDSFPTTLSYLPPAPIESLL